MPISHIHKIIFIHNPKVAGTSIASAFGMPAGHELSGDAYFAYREWWDIYFKFAFVRNPIDRFISCFEYAQLDTSYWHDNITPKDFPETMGLMHHDYRKIKGLSIEQVCYKLLNEPQNLQNPNGLHHPGWSPQSHFANCRDLDYVGKYEYFTEDMNRICELAKIDIPIISQVNLTPVSNKRDTYITDVVKKACTHLYGMDYENFCYHLPY